MQHKDFITVPSALGITGVDASGGRVLWSLEGKHGGHGVGCLATASPASWLPSSWVQPLEAVSGCCGFGGHEGSPARLGGMGTLALPCRNCSTGRAAQGHVVSSPAAVLQGSALTHFYLLEEARAAEPAPSLGACSAAGARWSSRTAPALGLVGQQHHCRELCGHLRDGVGSGEALAGCAETGGTGQLAAEGLSSSSPSTAVHAKEQTVKGEETGLGAFLGAGGVGG